MKRALLSIVAFAAFLPAAYGAGISSDEAELLIPTLTKLHLEDPLLTPVESSYELEAATAAGINAITKYLKNADGTITKKHYLMSFKEFGDGDDSAPNAYYYKWQDGAGGKKLVAATAADADVKVYLESKAAARMASNQNGADINSNFAGLRVTGTTSQGGAVYNTGSAAIGDMTGDFIGNYASGSLRVTQGGAIYNDSGATIGNITGDFIGNYTLGSGGGYGAYGGAIYNAATIGNIIGDFIGNYAFVSNYNGATYGGAIYNTGSSARIGDITGDFIGNYALNTIASYDAHGGAIYNSGGATIGNITGDFISNYVSNFGSNYVYGGAIFNNGAGTRIGDITGDFIGNYASSPGGACGGAIYNSGGTIGNIIGDFINNYASSTNASYGGAIRSTGSSGAIGNIAGNFISNYALGGNGGAQGGAIYNGATMGNITGDFIENYASSDNSTYGGAIYNGGSTARIGDITGNFINNYASGAYSYAYGGAIYNYSGGTIGNIIGDFINNYALNTGSGNAYGGAIYNAATIGNITGDFINNYASGSSNYVQGGAIFNSGSGAKIGNITGDFIGNYASTSGSTYIYGGAIYNYSGATISSILGDFINNYASSTGGAYGGAIYNSISSATISNITGDFTGNYALASGTSGVAQGGAIHNAAIIGNITGDFIGNYASGAYYAYGGAISNSGSSARIDNVTGDFIGNYVSSSGNNRQAYGGAIYNTGIITIIDSNFEDNFAQASAGTAKGGAIYAESGSSTNLISLNKDITFSGNYTNSRGTITSNAIHLLGNATAANAPSLNLNADEQRSIIFNDSITSESNNNVININKEGTGAAKEPTLGAPVDGIVVLNADMSGFGRVGTGNAVNFYNGVVKLGKDFNYFGVPINVVAGGNQLLDISNNGKLDNVLMNKFTLNNNLNVLMDVDLVGKTSDTFEGMAGGTESIEISGYNFSSHFGGQTDLVIADSDAKDRISLADSGKTAYTPIYKYDVLYNNGTGVLSFNGGGSSGDFNPSIMSPSVAIEAGALMAQMASYQHGFKTLDVTAFHNSMWSRTVNKHGNKYASAQTRGMAYIPQSPERYDSTNIWFQPYTVFENVQLKNAPDVSNIEYGTYVGADSKLYELKRGWLGMLGGYAGYNGSHQTFENVGIYQNGGTLGFTGSVFKNDFFSGLTINVSALGGRANTMYGADDFTTFMSGAALKSGYNLHFKESRMILQPSLLMGYSFIKTFDYVTASDVDMHCPAINTITLAPELRMIFNLKNGWQPYLGISGWWNIMGESKFRANNVPLPNIATKPYIQYGGGIQRLISDRLSAYGQVMVRNGGRNGVGLTFGVDWKL